MYILSEQEEEIFVKKHILNAKEKALLFLAENKGNDKALLFLTRLFLLAQNYNAEELLPLRKIKKNLNKLDVLSSLVDEFRKNVRLYDKEIKEIVQTGMKIRQEKNPSFPSFFKNKDRVFLQIEPTSSGLLYVQNILDDINRFLPEKDFLKVMETEDSFLVQSLKDQQCTSRIVGTKAGRFFKKQSGLLCSLVNKFSFFSNDSFNQDFISFLNGLTSYQDYQEQYALLKLKHPVIFPRSFLTPVLFYSLKSKGELSSIEDLKKRLKQLQNFYSKKTQELHLMQAVHQGNFKKQETIDMIILSKVPRDIAAMSAYADYSKEEWGSCLLPTGMNSWALPHEVGNGVFVAFCVNSKNPYKRLSRITVKPYINEAGSVFYGVGFMYGILIPPVREVLAEFLTSYQPALKGCFSLDENVYEDATTNRYYFKMNALDILKHQNQEVVEESDGHIRVGQNNQRQDGSYPGRREKMLDSLSGKKEVTVCISTDGIEKDVSFSNMDIYGSFSCYYLRKSDFSILPHHTNILTLTSSNINNFKGVDCDFFSLDMSFSHHLKSLEGLQDSCKEVMFSRMQMTSPVFKIPATVEKFNAAMSVLQVDHLDLSDFSGKIQFDESDLSDVKVFSYPKKASNLGIFFTELPSEMDLDASAFKSISLYPINTVYLTSFVVSKRLQNIILNKMTLPQMQLDLSHCTEIKMGSVSFENVTKLILPKEEASISFENCFFPKGITKRDILKNGGFDLYQKQEAIAQKRVSAFKQVQGQDLS